MEDEHYNYEFRTKAYSIIEPIFKQEISYRARFAANTLVSSLGISQDQATRLVIEYSLAKDLNEYPGNVRELPPFDPAIPPTPEIMEDELYRRTLWFTLGYVEDATEKDDNSTIFQGQYWLGNTPDETKALVGSMQGNPDQVVGYLRWAFQNDPALEDMLGEFTRRAKDGTLRPPSFEE